MAVLSLYDRQKKCRKTSEFLYTKPDRLVIMGSTEE